MDSQYGGEARSPKIAERVRPIAVKRQGVERQGVVAQEATSEQNSRKHMRASKQQPKEPDHPDATSLLRDVLSLELTCFDPGVPDRVGHTAQVGRRILTRIGMVLYITRISSDDERSSGHRQLWGSLTSASTWPHHSSASRSRDDGEDDRSDRSGDENQSRTSCCNRNRLHVKEEIPATRGHGPT